MKERIRQILMEGIIKEMEQTPKAIRVKMDMPIPSDIKQIKDIFVKNGHKLYVVGGAVRDGILNKPIKDYDLVTDAVPDKVESMMEKAGLRTLPTGKAFGVINVFTDSNEYEIATFREESGYSDSRRPDEVKFSNIETDVNRRDLTINALFYDIDSGEVIDFVGGINDLKKGIVRTVGVPEDRFNEDRLRIMRSLRFAGRFGSDLDPDTNAALRKDSSLKGISGERIRDEFLKGIKTSKSVKHYLSLIDRYKMWNEIFPGLSVQGKFIEDKDPIIVLSWLLVGNNPNELVKDLNKLKYSSDEVKAITFLISMTNFNINNVYKFKKLHNKSGVTDEQLRKFTKLIGLNQKLVEAFIKFNLTVTGQEVEDELGIKPGPDMGKAIEKIEIDNFKKMLS